MPRVPEYNQRQIALAPANTPYQTMKATAEMFGSDVGRAMTDLGKSLGSVADSLGEAAKYFRQQDQEKNETAAVDLFNQFTAAQGKIADSYQTLPGKLAVDGYTATEKQLSVLKRDYLSRAANSEQAELLSKAMEAGSATVLGQMQRYRDQQQGVYEDDVSTTRIDQSIQGIGRFYNDSREYAKGLYLAQAESLDQLRRHQAGPEEIKAALADVASRAMRARVEGAMAQRDSGAARNLFSLYEANLLPDDRAATSARLDHLEFNNRVEDETARILQASPLRIGAEPHGKTATEPSPPDAAGRLALAEKIADPQLRQSVKDRIASQNIRDQQTYLAQQRHLKGQAKDIIDRGGSVTDIPYQMLIGIDAKGKAALSAYAKAGGRITTDPVVYYGLKNLALDDPQAFLDVDLNDHLGEIKAKDLATLDQLQQSLRRGNHDPQLDLERVYKDNIDRTLRGLDLSATDIAKLYHQVDRDLAGYQAATGRKATPAEQQKIADQAVIDMKLDQRSFAMTRYGGVISTTSRTATANDNSLMIRTAGGDLHFANDAEPQRMQEEGSLKDLFGGQEMLVSGPAPATDRWRDEGARDRMVWQLAYPAGNVGPLYTGERKVIGPAELPDEGKSKAIMERERKNRELVREAELAIRYLQPAEVNPLSGPLVLLKKEEGGTGTFGYSRMDEFGNPKKHGGVDLVAPEGSPVYAIKPGEVIIERKSETYGYQVIIDHGNRLYSQYAHMEGKIVRRKNQSGGSDLVFVFKDKDGQEKELKSGDSVMAGTQIGAVGHTGNAGRGKAHLHLEIRYGNNGVDPNTRVLINPMYFLR